MQLRSSRGFNILELLEPDPSGEQSWRSRKALEGALCPELREVPLLIFSRPLVTCRWEVTLLCCVCVTSPAKTDDLWVPCIETFSFVLEGIGEDLNLRM